MSFNERLRKIEDRLSPAFPDFEMSCRMGWTLQQWFHRLAQVMTMPPGLDDDHALREHLRTAPADIGLKLPNGMIPPEPGPDELLNIVNENVHLLRQPPTGAPGNA